MTFSIPRYVFPKAPRNVYWETTIACGLACQHCRAEAISHRDPQELDTSEGRQLIDSIRRLGSLLVLTGGDPLERPDLLELVEYGRLQHVPIAVTPSTTPSLKRDTVERLKTLGITALGVSLDGPTPDIHDAFRGVQGTFAHSMNALDWAREFDVAVQINTTVTRFTKPHLAELYELLSRRASPPVRRWSLFLLVPTGRGSSLGALDASEVEQLFQWAYDRADEAPFHVSTVEAPHFRRYWLEREQASRSTDELVRMGARMGFGVRDGNGVVFVARNGDVFPAGFLPSPLIGNVRDVPLDELYRNSPKLTELRDMDRLTGKCGRCRYRWICGGSRARAWAASGDLWGDDPACIHDPGPHVEAPWPGHEVDLPDEDRSPLFGHAHPSAKAPMA